MKHKQKTWQGHSIKRRNSAFFYLFFWACLPLLDRL